MKRVTRRVRSIHRTTIRENMPTLILGESVALLCLDPKQLSMFVGRSYAVISWRSAQDECNLLTSNPSLRVMA